MDSPRPQRRAAIKALANIAAVAQYENPTLQALQPLALLPHRSFLEWGRDYLEDYCRHIAPSEASALAHLLVFLDRGEADFFTKQRVFTLYRERLQMNSAACAVGDGSATADRLLAAASVLAPLAGAATDADVGLQREAVCSALVHAGAGTNQPVALDPHIEKLRQVFAAAGPLVTGPPNAEEADSDCETSRKALIGQLMVPLGGAPVPLKDALHSISYPANGRIWLLADASVPFHLNHHPDYALLRMAEFAIDQSNSTKKLEAYRALYVGPGSIMATQLNKLPPELRDRLKLVLVVEQGANDDVLKRFARKQLNKDELIAAVQAARLIALETADCKPLRKIMHACRHLFGDGEMINKVVQMEQNEPKSMANACSFTIIVLPPNVEGDPVIMMLAALIRGPLIVMANDNDLLLQSWQWINAFFFRLLTCGKCVISSMGVWSSTSAGKFVKAAETAIAFCGTLEVAVAGISVTLASLMILPMSDKATKKHGELTKVQKKKVETLKEQRCIVDNAIMMTLGSLGDTVARGFGYGMFTVVNSDYSLGCGVSVTRFTGACLVPVLALVMCLTPLSAEHSTLLAKVRDLAGAACVAEAEGLARAPSPFLAATVQELQSGDPLTVILAVGAYMTRVLQDAGATSTVLPPVTAMLVNSVLRNIAMLHVPLRCSDLVDVSALPAASDTGLPDGVHCLLTALYNGSVQPQWEVLRAVVVRVFCGITGVTEVALADESFDATLRLFNRTETPTATVINFVGRVGDAAAAAASEAAAKAAAAKAAATAPERVDLPPVDVLKAVLDNPFFELFIGAMARGLGI